MFVLHFHGELDIQVLFTVQILEKVTAFVNSIPRMCRSRIWIIYSVWMWLSVSLSVQNVPWTGKLTTVNTAAGSLSHQVYRKPAYTENYLNYRSFHHPSVLRSINSTLVKRAHIVSDPISPMTGPNLGLLLSYGVHFAETENNPGGADIKVIHCSSSKLQSMLTSHKDRMR